MHFIDISQLKFSLKSETCSLVVLSSARYCFDRDGGGRAPSWLRICVDELCN